MLCEPVHQSMQPVADVRCNRVVILMCVVAEPTPLFMLLQHFLATEGQQPEMLAYDRPSPKLLAFLHKHYSEFGA